MLQAYEDTNVVLISRKSKDEQYNGLKKRQQKKHCSTENTTQHEPHRNHWKNSSTPDE